MSALCGVPDCHAEVTHIHGVREATSGGGAITHERQLYVYPRGPGDAPGNQGICSCGGPWPCIVEVKPEAQATDSIAAAKAHPAAHADAKWRNVTDPRYALTDTLLADLATCRKLGIEALDRYEADLTRERSALACHVCSTPILRDDEGRPCGFVKCPACDAKDCEALARERSARIAAEEARDKWKGCYQTQEIYLAKIEGILTEAEAENKRLSQALAYERDEYAQYREAHPWAAHALSSYDMP